MNVPLPLILRPRDLVDAILSSFGGSIVSRFSAREVSMRRSGTRLVVTQTPKEGPGT